MTDKSNTEQHILAAAEEEFLLKGYDGARTTSIARAAGVTHAMLHYYFRTKEALFEQVMSSKLQPIAQMLIAALGDKNLPVEERIKSGISAHFDFIATNPTLPKFFLNEVFTRQEFISVLRKCTTDTIIKELENLQNELNAKAKNGEMAKVDIYLLFFSIISLNAFSFLAMPMITELYGSDNFDLGYYLAKRKAENIETIMKRLKIQ